VASRQRAAGGADSKQRLVSSAVQLFSQQGYEATGVKEIAQRGQAPMGSFYFHFPGGKQALGVAALERGAEDFGRLLATLLESGDSLGEALAGCAHALADLLEASSWLDGCPVATTALESVGRSPVLLTAAARAFEQWQEVLRRRCEQEGLDAAASAELASNTLSLLEGAELLARVQQSTLPLEHAASALRRLAEAAPSGSAG
jgi:TetR/AcrR family transcriptional repressor of lmrAB and yxaGH operons